MRVAIVNDGLTIAEALRRVVASVPGYEVAWLATDGAQAVRRAAEDRPDLVLMDLVMPTMDGVEATRRIMASSPCAILVVTATVEGHADMVFAAMGHGALDAVDTPPLGRDADGAGRQRLLEKIATIARLLGFQPSRGRVEGEQRKPASRGAAATAPALVAVGASTGGPRALATIVAALPAGFPGAVVVVQHVDRAFAPGLAQWLDAQSAVAVRVVESGERPTPGAVLVAASNDHLVVRPDLSLGYTREPLDNPFRPSVDVLFDSLWRCWPEPGVAVLLTGMGRDGARGLLQLRRAGWHTVAQDQDSSAVYGMPRAAAEMGAVEEVLPVDRIGPSLVQRLGRSAPRSATLARPGGG